MSRVTLFYPHPQTPTRRGLPGRRRVVGARAVGTPRAQVRAGRAVSAEAEPRGASRRRGPAGGVGGAALTDLLLSQ